MRKQVLYFLLFCLVQSSQAQLDTCWNRSFGGSADEPPGFGSGYLGAPELKMALDPSGNIWIISATQSNNGDVWGSRGGHDAWILKINPQGDTLFTKILGGTGTDVPLGLVMHPHNGCLVAGYSASNDGDFMGNRGLEDAFLVRLDSQGNTLWRRSYGGSQGDVFFGLIAQPQGYFAYGLTGSVDGDLQGQNPNAGSVEAWLAKLDSSGNILWQRTSSGLTNDDDYSEHFWDAVWLPDSNQIALIGLTGNFNDFNTDNLLFAKYDTAGNRIWLREYGSTARDVANGIMLGPNGSFFALGAAYGSGGVTGYRGGSADFWLLQLDAQGQMLRNQCLGGTGIDYPYSFELSPQGQLFLCGITNSSNGEASRTGLGSWDFFLMSLDSSTWDTSSTLRWGGSDFDYLHQVAFGAQNKMYFLGRSMSSNGYLSQNRGGKDLYLGCFSSPDTTNPVSIGVLAPNAEQLRCYPNPSQGQFFVEYSGQAERIRVYNPLGQLVVEQVWDEAQEQVSLQGLGAGSYWLEVRDQNGSTKGRLLLLKP